jgi:multicomponent Na+:H+ antiporter subunit E
MRGRFIALIVTWVALWGEVNLANVLTGAVVAVVITFVFPVSQRVDHRLHLWGTVKFLSKFVMDLFVSSITVARAVLFPNEERLRAHTVSVQLHTQDPLITTVICNAMTLTPGTLTVAIDSSTRAMRLHVLGAIDEEIVQQQVYELERRVMAAVSSRAENRKAQ